jgi:peptidoglycan hydrolase CwlO-like protein
MDLLRACDDLKSLIETAQKLIKTWDEDRDNYSKLEQHLTELKAEIEKLKD